MSTAEAEDNNLSEYDRDKIKKQSLVRNTLAKHFTEESPFAEIRAIASALQANQGQDNNNNNNDIILLTNLSGGYTNYTYKISVGDINLFAKLCFPRAFWNPDPDYTYDTSRIHSEKVMMERFAELAPDCVAEPYMLIDLKDDMKILVTKWAPGDEQLANQFIDGVPDIRVAEKLGEAISSLHCTQVDPDFNTDARECMIDIFPSLKEILLHLATSSSPDKGDNRFAKLAQQFGPEVCGKLIERAVDSYRSKEILVHSDLHAFNCLVEAKNDYDENTFGEKGLVVVCDWEMAMKGPLGLDTGRAFSIPVACILAHSINGNDEVVAGLMKWMGTYWDTYASFMKAKGINDNLLLKGYRNGMAWLGWKLYAMSVFEWFLPFLPIQQVETEIGSLKESLGVVGISLMRVGFDDDENNDLSLEQLQSTLNDVIQTEISNIASHRDAIPVRRRRSSILREQNRRVSDAFINLSSSTRNSLNKIAEDLDMCSLEVE